MTLISRRQLGLVVGQIGLAGSLGCSKTSDSPSHGNTAPSARDAATRITLQGSGASFPAPVYSRWFREFSDKNPNIRVNYQSTGSGAGIKAFLADQVDFGASDAALNDQEVEQANGNVLMLPTIAGHIVLAYNLPGVSELKLTREAYTGLFLGEISNWRDAKIAASNPNVDLPNLDVTPVNRSDGSGTTFVFTQHLAAIDEKWRAGPGSGKSVSFPAKGAVGGAKNDGVAALVQRTPGAVGYVEYVYAVTSRQTVASLQNKSGKFVAPTQQAARAALDKVELPADMRAWVTDPEGDESYPITSYTWILAKRKYENQGRAAALKRLLAWCLAEGQPLAESLHYVALPGLVAERVRKAVETIE